MAKHALLKKRLLFNPDVVITKLHQALRRDIELLPQEYERFGHGLAHAMRLQADSFLDRYQPVHIDKPKLELETFEKFKATNVRMEQVNKHLLEVLPDPKKRVQRKGSFSDNCHLRARALVHFVLADLTEDEWFLACKNSQGSSVGVPFTDTSQERKFTFPISATETVVPWFNRYMEWDATLRSAVAAHNEQSNGTDSGVYPYNVVPGSRATTVDKTATKRRLICVEPTANMFLQQGLMEVMYSRLAHLGLDVGTLPDEHRLRAMRASITADEATIDWSSASDCVSTELLRWLLPPKWFSVVNQLRSPQTLIGKEDVPLHMFATMGNAGTFPLETIVFWAYGHAVRLSLQDTNDLFPEWEDLKVISVFGDDCIVPTYMAKGFIEFLSSVGFTVNDDKSFYGDEGFRESCGGDYLHGIDVRPYKPKAPGSCKRSALEPWLYTMHNALLQKYIQYFGTLSYVYDKQLWRAFANMYSEYGLKIKLVPSYFPDDAGLKVTDVTRYWREYGATLSPIHRSKHGTYKFSYLRFVYKKHTRKDDFISYAIWLKKPSISESRLSFKTKEGVLKPFSNPNRRVGGYVVATGISCHWHVPKLL